MTEELFREDGYLRSCEAVVTAVTDRGFAVDRTVFYPVGGGSRGIPVRTGAPAAKDGSWIATGTGIPACTCMSSAREP